MGSEQRSNHEDLASFRQVLPLLPAGSLNPSCSYRRNVTRVRQTQRRLSGDKVDAASDPAVRQRKGGAERRSSYTRPRHSWLGGDDVGCRFLATLVPKLASADLGYRVLLEVDAKAKGIDARKAAQCASVLRKVSARNGNFLGFGHAARDDRSVCVARIPWST